MTRCHPFPEGQTRLTESEIADVRADLAENNAAARAALAKHPRGLHPRVAALRDAQEAPDKEL